ncbi:MAG: hypothetical protein DRI71_04135 [Bacteroidetes bacterium]|nr:MAG: hypothetical protein DRI71_04135 [Bacteroidota bacterium]
MKYRVTLLISILLFVAELSMAQEDENKVEINGFVRNFTGVLLTPPNEYSIIQNTLNLEFSLSSDKFALYANPYYFQYPNKEDEFNIREIYVDIYLDKFDFRFGKQQVVWGQADGVFITDIVSPLDLTDFLMRDFNEIRLGVNAAKINYYPSFDHSFEFIWIANFTPGVFPSDGSIWQPQVDFPAPPTFDNSNREVPFTLESSEFFLKYSLSKAWADIQLIGAYTWDDAPSMHVTPIAPPDPNAPGLLIKPEYHRLGLVGASFNTQIADFVIRGEGAYYFDKNWQTTDPTATDFLVEKDYVNYVVGLDKTIGDWKLSGQFIQRIISDYDEAIKSDDVDNLATLLISKSLFRETLRLEWFSYYGINNNDALIRFRGFYYPHDAVSIELGTNIFTGTTGMFGQYNNNDMIYTRIKYNF